MLRFLWQKLQIIVHRTLIVGLMVEQQKWETLKDSNQADRVDTLVYRLHKRLKWNAEILNLPTENFHIHQRWCRQLDKSVAVRGYLFNFLFHIKYIFHRLSRTVMVFEISKRVQVLNFLDFHTLKLFREHSTRLD
jgi:hypothetical protein